MKRIVLFFFAAMILASCAKTPQPEQTVVEEADVFKDNSPDDDGYGVLTKSEEAKLSRVNQFAFSLLKKVDEMKPGSTYVFSPMSMAYVLGMLSEGTAGTTRDEICSALGFGLSDREEISSFLKSLTAKVERSLSPAQEEAYAEEGLSPADEEEAPLKIANIIIADTGHPIKASYRESVMDFYSAMVENLDFEKEDVAQYINDWASDYTDGRINKVTDRIIGQACCLNAIDFNAKWQKADPFNVQRDLFLGETEQRTEQILSDPLRGVYYYKGEDFGLVEIPLKDKRNYIAYNYRFVILLPDPGLRISNIALTDEIWQQATSSATHLIADLSFPKFSTSFSGFEDRIADLLQSAGISTVFSDDADFSALTDSDVAIKDFRHLSNISVDEYGVTASAASYSSWGSGSPLPDIVFHANRPFVFAVTEKTTGAILFLGCYR